MQPRLNLPRRGVLAFAAVMLATGIALAPTLALADDQPSDDLTQQMAVVEDGEAQVDSDTAASENDSGASAVTPATELSTDGQPDSEEPEAPAQSEGVAQGTMEDAAQDATGATSADGQASTTDTTASEASDAPSPAADSLTDQAGTEATGDEASTDVDTADVTAVLDGQTADAPSEAEAASETAAEPTAPSETTEATPTTLTATLSSGEAELLTSQQDYEYQNVAEGTYIFETDIASADGLSLAKLVLDARGAAREGADLITWTYSGKSNQKWVVTRRLDNWYSIASYADKSLVITATDNSGRLYLTKYSAGLASQLWAFLLNSTSYGSGYQMIPKGIQASATDKTIVNPSPDVAVEVRNNSTTRGASIVTTPRSESGDADLSFYAVNPTPKVSAGAYGLEGRYLFHVPDTSYVLEVSKGSSAKGASIWTWVSNGKAHQDIYLQYEGSGFYSAWVIGTKKVLDVSGGSILPGANVIQWTYGKGKTNQQWAVRKNANGTYTLVNRATGLALGGVCETDDGYKLRTNIAGVQNNGRVNNGFVLERCALLSPGIYKLTKTSTGKVVDVKGAATKGSAAIDFYTDKGNKNALNQRFELVSAGSVDKWRIRTACSGGWITVTANKNIIQYGNHATAQNRNNTWEVILTDGEYRFRCNTNTGNRYLGGWTSKYKVTSAPLGYTGLFEISSVAANVALDNPKGSSTSGSSINVFRRNNGVNQRFYIEKSGTGYKITNLVSDLVLTASDSSSKVVQTAFAGEANQLWTFGIADGGHFKLINSGTKQALDISGTGTISTTRSTSSCASNDSASREKRQSWKLTTKPLPIYEKLAQVAMHFVDHSAHGYSQPHRGEGGSERIKLRDGTRVTISKADVDCSEMVRQCVNAALGRTAIAYMWTGDQKSNMLSANFKLLSFKTTTIKRGDILWRTGHTCVALGNGKTAEALASELHDIDGKAGDQTGKEVAYGTVGTNWTYVYRWVKTVD